MDLGEIMCASQKVLAIDHQYKAKCKYRDASVLRPVLECRL
jgi:hypothetical protein